MAIILKKIKQFFCSIRLRLVAIYFVVISLALLLMILFILDSIRGYSLQTLSGDMLESANLLSSTSCSAYIETMDASVLPKPGAWAYTDAGIMVLDTDGRVLFDSNESSGRRGKILATPWVLRAIGGENLTVERTLGNDPYMLAAVPIYKGTDSIGILITRTSTKSQYAFFSHMKDKAISIAWIGSVVIGLFGIFLSVIFTAPLSRLTKQIKDMAETESKKPVHIRGGNEIMELVSAFNLMVERMDTIDNRRQEFVSNASHELKTPLSSIKLICDSLLQNPETDQETVQEFLYDMNEQVDRLTRIINKLLSLTKLDSLEASKEGFAFSTVNLHTLVSGVIKALSPLAANKNIMLDAHLQENIFLRVDADKIWEAVYNILDNSIKYTPADGRVYTELYRDEDHIYISIADNGIGMAETEFAKIFERFYRVDKARARETGGTGLGLSIALSAVELHGGYIEVESREGEGSLFRIVLPVSTTL